jgi:S1/P1 Nuclease
MLITISRFRNSRLLVLPEQQARNWVARECFRTERSNLTRLRNEATALRTRQEFQRSQLTELASTGFESWGKESFEIATKIAYRNGGRIGIPRSGNLDCTMVAAAPVLPTGYVTSASRIADRRVILAGYRLADLLTRLTSKLD